MIRLRVHAGPYARHVCPVSIPLDFDPGSRVTLYQHPSGKPRACQLVPEGTGSRLHWMITRLEAGAICDYEVVLTPNRRRPVPRLVWDTLAAEHLRITLDAKALAEWSIPAGDLPGLSAVIGPGGQAMVETIRCSARLIGRTHQLTTCELEPSLDGVTLARLTSRGFWHDAAGLPIMEEHVTYACHATPADLSLIDVTMRLTASVGPVKFESHGEGLLHLELAPELRAGEATNSLGVRGPEACGEAAAWVRLSSRGGDLVVFDQPANPGSPCRWQLGELGETLSADPFGAVARLGPLLSEQPLTLPTGESLLFRYRLCFLGPEARRRSIVGRFVDFAHPPRVQVLAEGRG